MRILVQILVPFFCLHAFVSATPIQPEEKIHSRDDLPLLDLPYATYRASSYSKSNDIYTFRNIRYAAPPVGNLRWAKPAPPLKQDGVQDGSIGNHCLQAGPNGLNLLGSGNQSPIGGAANQFLGGIPLPLFNGGDEDCLFLDMYVPGKALKDPSMKLPVMVFISGGAYLFGSKDSLQPSLPFYDGTGMISQSGNNMIFVALNYRLGAFGFLAGSTMEKEGLPNAGLWDQRAAFQWVKDHISLVGGDSNKVTAMGQSAGAGSIMHHLVGQAGQLDPLFSKAVLLSPAFEYMWDRAGTVQKTFEMFAGLAGCEGKGVDCLRAADSTKLTEANTALMKQQFSGTFAVGPTPDGTFIRQLPVLELSTGHFWNVDSLILSHTADEPRIFTSGLVQTDAEFVDFINHIFPNYTQAAGITDKIASFYPKAGAANSPFESQTDRVEALLRDSSFTCNVRHTGEALGNSKVWNFQYSVTPGWHATDLFPIFYTVKFDGKTFLQRAANLFLAFLSPLISGYSRALQSYLTSYTITGDPNTNRKVMNVPPTINWPHPDSSGEKISGVVSLGDWGFSTIDDDQDQKSPCDFWREVAAAVTSLGGYSPPGAVVSQKLVSITADASRNYKGGN